MSGRRRAVEFECASPQPEARITGTHGRRPPMSGERRAIRPTPCSGTRERSGRTPRPHARRISQDARRSDGARHRYRRRCLIQSPDTRRFADPAGCLPEVMTGILRPRCPATDRRAWCWRRTSIGMRPPRGRSATPPLVLSHRRWHPRPRPVQRRCARADGVPAQRGGRGVYRPEHPAGEHARPRAAGGDLSLDTVVDCSQRNAPTSGLPGCTTLCTQRRSA